VITTLLCNPKIKMQNSRYSQHCLISSKAGCCK